MRRPYYKQYDAMDCGPACLKMIAKYYQKNISLQELREKSQIGKEGVNLLGISAAAEGIGFRTRAVKLNYAALASQVKLPVILHWDQRHFVVLYEIRKNSLLVADPARSLLRYSKSEFITHWVSDITGKDERGIALQMDPTPEFYRDDHNGMKEDTGLAFKNIFQYLVSYKKLFFQLMLGMGISSLLLLFLPFLTQSIVDVGINTGNIQFVYIILFGQFALFLGRIAVDFVRGWLLLHISTRINVSIVTDFLIKLMKLPVSFFDSKHTGDILQRISDHSRIESFLTGSSLNTFFSLLNLVIFSVVLAVFNANIFIIFAVASSLYILWVISFLKRGRALDYKRFEIAAKAQSATIQIVQAMQEIKLNGIERKMRWGWEQLQARQFKLNMKGLTMNQWQQSGASFINETKNILISFLAAKAVIEGQLTLGGMLSVQFIIGQLNSPIEQMIGFIQSWQNARISMDRLNEIHKLEDEEPEHKHLQQYLPASFTKRLVGGGDTGQVADHPVFENPGHSEAILYADGEHCMPGNGRYKPDLPADPEDTDRHMSGMVHLQNVSFAYPGAGNEPVLKNINLSIPQGKTTAIVGTSGSGKTTLLKLLLKFHDPVKGDIKLGNTSLKTVSHRAWRSHCGVVMQESHIFSDTIGNNIGIGHERVDLDRLHNAAEIANIHEFIESLPLGYNTRIGNEGTGISMGQRQRILIARAVYRDPQFIFFDEATNSLDANNESIILNNLQSFLRGRTVIVVAHRLSTVSNAHQIVLLNKGVIAELGTHQELVDLKGAYYTLVKNQLELGQ